MTNEEKLEICKRFIERVEKSSYSGSDDLGTLSEQAWHVLADISD